MLRKRGVPFLFSTAYNAGDIPPQWPHAKVAIMPLHLSSVEALSHATRPLSAEKSGAAGGDTDRPM